MTAITSDKAPQHRIYNACRLEHIFGLGYSHFARRYQGNNFYSLFLRVLRCFSSPRSPLLPMNSVIDIKILLLIGFPIQKSPDLNLFSGSPKLIAANHVFHRLLAPRHPPCALCSLTINQITQRKCKSNYPINLSKNKCDSKSESKNQIHFNSLFQISRINGGGKRDRTADPLRARQVLSQLSYTPTL